VVSNLRRARFFPTYGVACKQLTCCEFPSAGEFADATKHVLQQGHSSKHCVVGVPVKNSTATAEKIRRAVDVKTLCREGPNVIYALVSLSLECRFPTLNCLTT